MIGLLFALTVKHFVVDFCLQPPFMWRNKGTYGHPGGLAHAGLHAATTFVILMATPAFWKGPLFVLGIALIEFFIHYHMDWFKMWYNAKKGWGATTHNEFWVLLGVDQMVHSLTYLLIAWMIYSS